MSWMDIGEEYNEAPLMKDHFHMERSQEVIAGGTEGAVQQGFQYNMWVHANENRNMLEWFLQPNNVPGTSIDAQFRKNKATVQDAELMGSDVQWMIQCGTFKENHLRETMRRKCYSWDWTHSTRMSKAKAKIQTTSRKDATFLMQAQEIGASDWNDEQSSDECDAFDSDIDEGPTTQTMFMANLTSKDPICDEAGPSYDSNTLYEVQDHDTFVDHLDEYQKYPVQSDGIQSRLANKPNMVVKDLVTSELARYKELVGEYEKQAKVELEKVKQHYKELYDSIKITRAHTSEKTSTMLNEIESLKAQLRSKESCFTVTCETLSTEESGSKPRSNTKKKRIMPAKSENKKKVEDHHRTNKSVGQNSVNATPTVKRVLNKGKQIWKPKCKLFDNKLNMTKRVWKEMGKLFADIGCQWRTPRKEIHLRKLDCGFYQWRDLRKKIWPLGEMCPLLSFLVEMFYSTVNQQAPTKIGGTGNAKLAKIRLFQMQVVQVILGLLDSSCSKHMMGNRSKLKNFRDSDIYVEGLGHNLFSVGQFCDSDIEVAFRKHTCFVRDINGADILKGSRSTNLYTISIDDMMKSSSICLMSKASKSKSWLWHRRLNHLKFGTNKDPCSERSGRGFYTKIEV
ncbi:integrase, catalytic region, zinc finger, CCHC-type containing protein [Tanacetum coccineum]|uniref:Integrase, catalytic region, zinc finger, CCHC-type containing protein n=1 Tax=Tanacetum coccineum TaxID=301880 RepID=A0ABQ5CRP3_9ASTR